MTWRSLALAAFLSPLPALSLEPVSNGEAAHITAEYIPDPEIEGLIERTADPDKSVAEKALVKIAGFGPAADRALQWHLARSSKPADRLRWAELIARCSRGRTGYRVSMELQPAGTGGLELWSDRALLAECAKKQDRLLGRPETPFTEEALRFNPYGKGELLKYIGEGMKFQEARVEGRGRSIEAVGVITFQSFDALSKFAGSFDPGGYQMLSGITLTDADDGTRTLRFKKEPERNKQQFQNFLQLFHDVKWEFVLDFRGRLTRHNAHRTAGSKLIWTFNCYQMMTGDAAIEVTYNATGLPPRVAIEKGVVDNAVALPSVVQANQPIAVPKQKVVRARTSKRDVNDRSTVINLDGSGSLPRVPNLQYQWTQIAGLDLGLPSAALAKPTVGLKIYEPGEYRFELIVSLDGQVSKPSVVQVLVDEYNTKPADGPTAVGSTPERSPERTPAIAKAPVKPLESDVGMLGMPAEKKTDTKKVYLDELKLKYGSIERFNQVWGSHHRSWDEISGKSSTSAESETKDTVVAHAAPKGSGPTPAAVKGPAPGPQTDPRSTKPATDDYGPKPDPKKPAFWQPPPVDVAPKVEPKKEIPPVDVKPAVAKVRPEVPVEPKIEAKVEPKVAVKVEPKVEAKIEPKIEAKVEPKVEARVEPKIETKLEPKVLPKVEAKVEPKVEPKVEAKLEPKIETKVAPKIEPKIEPKNVTAVAPPPPDIKKDPVAPAPKEPKTDVAVAPPPEAPKGPKSGPPAGPADTAQGLALLKAGKYTDAKPILEAAASANPNSQEPLFYWGVALMESGELQPAASKFENASNMKGPLTANALMNAGHCFSRLNKMTEAGAWYKKGYKVAGDKVFWEINWQHGNKKLAAKDFNGAMEKLSSAESEAAAAGVKDYRLLRDLAIALHNNGQSADAASRLKAMQELGYTPDPALVAEIRKGGGTVAASNPAPETKTAAPAGTPPNDSTAPGAGAPPTNSVAEVKGPAPSKVETAPGTQQAPEPAPPARETKKPKREVKPPPPKRPLPPIPVEYGAAVAGGTKAYEEGVAFLKENTDESKAKAAYSWDVAEAMLRSAWEQKPGDEQLVTAFRDLSKHSGPIALVPNPVLKSKVKGLVVLDASASIVAGKDKKMFCAWTQIEGEDIGLRPEEMAQPQVGLKIRRPGSYKFELAVSDGSRGGNPVTVTVEVSE